MPTNKERIAALEATIAELKRRDEDRPLTLSETRELTPEEAHRLLLERMERERDAEKYEFSPRERMRRGYANSERAMEDADDQTPRGKRKAIREADSGDSE